MVRDQRLVGDVRDDELVQQPLRVGEAERVAVAGDGGPSAPSRSAQKSSASAEPTRQTTVCTMPEPARPGPAPGYSKKVMSEPALPCSSA